MKSFYSTDDSSIDRDRLEAQLNVLISLLPKASSSAEKAQLYYQIGSLLDKLAYELDAETYYLAAANVFDQLLSTVSLGTDKDDLKRQKAQALLRVGEIRLSLNLDGSRKAFDLVNEIAIALQDKLLQAIAKYRLGSIEKNERNLQDALKSYQEAERLIRLAGGLASESLRAKILSSIVLIQQRIDSETAYNLARNINEGEGGLLEPARKPVLDLPDNPEFIEFSLTPANTGAGQENRPTWPKLP